MLVLAAWNLRNSKKVMQDLCDGSRCISVGCIHFYITRYFFSGPQAGEMA